MRSPLECIDGSFSSAVFTTYSLNLRFFEHWVLPLLHAVGARNVIVLADATQLGAALEDHGLRGVGRSYHVVSTRLGPGAFHPKLIFLSSDDAVRACVSSANLTVDGQLRNVEAAVVLDSGTSGHGAALADAAEFLRRCAVQAPAHTVDALLAALPVAPDTGEPSSATLRLVHNLDEPLLGRFPRGDLTAVSPFADAGQAATALGELGDLTVVTDGDTFAAPEVFFEGSWTVVPRKLWPRRLHGKAYWNESWLMVGSPNLSAPALLQTAANGNTELAVEIEGELTSFTGDLPGGVWTDRPLNELAPDRHRLERLAEAERERVGSFDAWEDDGEIVVAGIDDSELEHWNPQSGRWEPLGAPVAGRLTPPTGTRPHLLRGREPNGRIRQAVVHRTRVLRSQREQPKTTSRGAQAISTLPLDLQGVKALEDVLHDLYALESLGAESEPTPEPAAKGHESTAREPETLTEWRPAREEDEPRIPELYRRAWTGEPDTLLALIRKALRLDEQHQPDDEAEVREEKVTGDEEGLEQAAAGGSEEADGTLPPPEPARTTASVLRRYRGALLKLLERGVTYVRTADSAVLADLGFIAILRLHEELGHTRVNVDEVVQPLVDGSELMAQKVGLLDAYLRERGGRDPSCLATARAHLGLCLVARDQLTPLAWENLEGLAHRHSAGLLADNPYAERAAHDAAIDLADLELRIRPYAERADWGGFVVNAETYLDRVDCGEQPFPWVSGADWFTTTTVSPAWKLAAYGAVAGFQNRQRYGVYVRNQQPKSKVAAHLVVIDPASSRIHEAFKRSGDGQWMTRSYSSVSEGSVAKTGAMGPDSILDDSHRSHYTEVDGSGAPVILELLEAVGEVAVRD